jgi:uncharacterized protein
MAEPRSNGEKLGRPIPRQGSYVNSGPFWSGAKEGRLMLQYCVETGQFQHYPRSVSIYTGKRRLEWREVSGKGSVYACTVLRIPGDGLEGRLPLSVATIDLDEGVRVIANVLRCSPEEVKIGARVKLCWDKLGDDVNYPAFELE